jgi:hypothetical protein
MDARAVLRRARTASAAHELRQARTKCVTVADQKSAVQPTFFASRLLQRKKRPSKERLKI